MHKNLINGGWIAGAEPVENNNPADPSDVIGLYARASAEQVTWAVDAASTAFASWSRSTPQYRADLFENAAQRIMARKDDLGQLLVREEGKTLPEAVGETVRAAQIFRFFAGEALRITGDAVASVRPDIDVEVLREPVGVVGLITPWNFPVAIPAWKIAPALAYGNTVVMKPADLTPGCTHALAEILYEAGFPPGVFNLVMGRGSVVGNAILDDPRVDAVSFTGSVPVGRELALKAAKGLKKVQLEMGGKNPTVVMEDADIDLTIGNVVNAAFYSTGQRARPPAG